MPIWSNQDGLTIKTGRDEAVSGTTGQYGETFSGNHVLETNLVLTTLNTATQTIVSDVIRFPKNFRLERVETYVETAATSGGASTLDFGFINPDRLTEFDYDGLIAGGTLASLNTSGKRTNYDVGSTGSGVLVGQLAPNIPGCYLVAKAGGAVFTGGVIKIRTIFHKP